MKGVPPADGRTFESCSRRVLFGRHTAKMGLLTPAAQVDTALADTAPSRAGCFDVVVDATGSPAGLNTAQALCRPLGTLVLKSTCAAGTDFNTAPFVVDELKIIGSRCGPFPVSTSDRSRGHASLCGCSKPASADVPSILRPSSRRSS